jgi:hypothetical protein
VTYIHDDSCPDGEHVHPPEGTGGEPNPGGLLEWAEKYKQANFINFSAPLLESLAHPYDLHYPIGTPASEESFDDETLGLLEDAVYAGVTTVSLEEQGWSSTAIFFESTGALYVPLGSSTPLTEAHVTKGYVDGEGVYHGLQDHKVVLDLLEAWKTKGKKLSAAHRKKISDALKARALLKGKVQKPVVHKKPKKAEEPDVVGFHFGLKDPKKAAIAAKKAAMPGTQDMKAKYPVGTYVKTKDGLLKVVGHTKGYVQAEGGKGKWYKFDAIEPGDSAGAPHAKIGGTPGPAKKPEAPDLTPKGKKNLVSLTAVKAEYPSGTVVKTPHGEFEVVGHTTGYVQVAGGKQKYYKVDAIEKVEAKKAPDLPATISKSGLVQVKGKTLKTPEGDPIAKEDHVILGGKGYKVLGVDPDGKVNLKAFDGGGVEKVPAGDLAKASMYPDPSVKKLGAVNVMSPSKLGESLATSRPGEPDYSTWTPAAKNHVADLKAAGWTAVAKDPSGYEVFLTHPDHPGTLSVTKYSNLNYKPDHDPYSKPPPGLGLAPKPKVDTSPPIGGMPGSSAGLQHVKGLGGSTGATLVKDPATGEQYVLKHGSSKDHLAAEYGANKVYEAAGVGVPKATLVDDGKTQLSKYQPGTPLADLKGQALADARAQVAKSFVLDAVLGNRDVVGPDNQNVMVGDDGVVRRIDTGAAFDYRAQGSKKEFTADVGELKTLRDPAVNPTAAKVYESLTPADVRKQALDLHANREAVLAATPEKYRDTVSARIDDVLKKTGGIPGQQGETIPTGLKVGVAPHQVPGATAGKAKTADGVEVGVGDSLHFPAGDAVGGMKVKAVHPDGKIDVEVGGQVVKGADPAGFGSGVTVTKAGPKVKVGGGEEVGVGDKIKAPNGVEMEIKSVLPSGKVNVKVTHDPTGTGLDKVGDLDISPGAGHTKVQKTAPSSTVSSGPQVGTGKNGVTPPSPKGQVAPANPVKALHGTKEIAAAHPVGSVISLKDGTELKVTGHTTGYVYVEGGPKKMYKVANLAAQGATYGAGSPHASNSGLPAAGPTGGEVMLKGFKGGGVGAEVKDAYTGEMHKVTKVNADGSFELASLQTGTVTQKHAVAGANFELVTPAAKAPPADQPGKSTGYVDKNGKDLAVGDKVEWAGSKGTVVKGVLGGVEVKWDSGETTQPFGASLTKTASYGESKWKGGTPEGYVPGWGSSSHQAAAALQKDIANITGKYGAANSYGSGHVVADQTAPGPKNGKVAQVDALLKAKGFEYVGKNSDDKFVYGHPQHGTVILGKTGKAEVMPSKTPATAGLKGQAVLDASGSPAKTKDGVAVTIGDVVKNTYGAQYKILGQTPNGDVLVSPVNFSGNKPPVYVNGKSWIGTSTTSMAPGSTLSNPTSAPSAAPSSVTSPPVYKHDGSVPAPDKAPGSPPVGIPGAYVGAAVSPSAPAAPPADPILAAHKATPPAPANTSVGTTPKYDQAHPPVVGQAVYVQGKGNAVVKGVTSKDGVAHNVALEYSDGTPGGVALPADLMSAPGHTILKPYDPGKASSTVSHGYGGDPSTGKNPFTPMEGWPTGWVKGDTTKNNPAWVAKQESIVAHSLTGTERSAVTAYTGSAYTPINNHLRHGDSLSDSNKKHLDGIDKAMAKMAADHDFMVYRGIGNDTKTGLPVEMKVGDVFKDKGYMSTSVVKGSEFGGSTKMEILVPKGTPGMYARAVSKFKSEDEFLLGRGTTFIVHEITYVNGTRHVRLEAVPPNAPGAAKYTASDNTALSTAVSEAAGDEMEEVA